ncbi:MAG: hypothetical protein LBM67_03320 [Lentimicrobiaceae bacterium]|jgi:hypothetical protein|nr:hypothetical protein [Lentimicrobiaceae bacterium]
MNEKFFCPCCGYDTLNEEPPGTALICPICFWEDDYEQYNNPDRKRGANTVSLRQAKQNFQRIGAISAEFCDLVIEPDETYKRNPNWKLK